MNAMPPRIKTPLWYKKNGKKRERIYERSNDKRV